MISGQIKALTRGHARFGIVMPYDCGEGLRPSAKVKRKRVKRPLAHVRSPSTWTLVEVRDVVDLRA
jgi:hypothetical protein